MIWLLYFFFVQSIWKLSWSMRLAFSWIWMISRICCYPLIIGYIGSEEGLKPRNRIINHSDDSHPFHPPWLESERSSMWQISERALPPFHAQWGLFNSSSWVDWVRISDRKFVNHTTEMILWSMILFPQSQAIN